MAHALRRILYCSVDSKKHLFAMVSSNPETGPEGIYSHVFATAKKDQVIRVYVLFWRDGGCLGIHSRPVCVMTIGEFSCVIFAGTVRVCVVVS